jgi:hypothetical protein
MYQERRDSSRRGIKLAGGLDLRWNLCRMDRHIAMEESVEVNAKRTDRIDGCFAFGWTSDMALNNQGHIGRRSRPVVWSDDGQSEPCRSSQSQAFSGRFHVFNSTQSLLLQNARAKGRGGRRTRPYAFTEQGVSMLSSLVKSERARGPIDRFSPLLRKASM